jgi:hypothetical protein
MRPDEAAARIDLADGEGWLADVARLSGDLSLARAHRLRQKAMLTAVLIGRGDDARYLVPRIAGGVGLARVEAARGDFTAAQAELDVTRQFANALAGTARSNKAAARQQRVIDLFQAQIWLMMPPGERTRVKVTPAMLAATIGTCDAEWRKARNDELAAFCTLLSAEAAAALGDRNAARVLLAGLRQRPIMERKELSEWWRLDLHGMLEGIASRVRGVSRPTSKDVRTVLRN